MAFWQMRKNTTLCEDHQSPEIDMMIVVFKDGTVEAYKNRQCYRAFPQEGKSEGGWEAFLNRKGGYNAGKCDERSEVHCDEVHE